MLAVIGRIMGLARAYRGRIVAAFVFSLVKAILASAPIGIATVTVARMLEGSLTPADCGVIAILLAILLAAQAACQYAADRLQSSAGYELMAELRLRLAEHLRRLPMGFYAAGNTGRVSSVLSADLVFIEENCMKMLADIMSDFFTQAVLTVFLLVIDPAIGGVALITETACVAVGSRMRGVAERNSVRRQTAVQDLNTAAIDFAESVEAAHANPGARLIEQGPQKSFAAMTEANIAFENDFTPWLRGIYGIIGAGTTAILIITIVHYQTGTIELFSAIAIALLLFSLFGPMRRVYGQSATLAVMDAAIDRFEALMQEPELPDRGHAPMPTSSPANTPEIAFDRVTFSYEGAGEPAVADVSLSVAPRTTCALVGPSGSGKSTIASLIARFWDVQEGSVRVRGVDIRDLPLDTLSDHVAMVFQNVYLFQGTIEHNIRMGRRDATRDEVIAAARRARCHDFIMRLPYGYDTPVGEGGATLSGGEAQRISIARAILKDAPIVILDEATSSVDPDNEEAIQQALDELCRGKTLVVIAHRLGTVRDADQIIVLERGHIVESGTPQELLARSDGRWRTMLASYAGEEARA